MPALTPNYNFYLPLVNDPTDQDLWGGYINANFTSLDSILKTLITVGQVSFFPANVAPSGWLELGGSAISRTTYANLWTYAQASGNLSTLDTSAIGAASVIRQGAGYVAGSYTGVPLTGGSGSGATANITVNASGQVSAVTLVSNTPLAPGSAYVVGDQLSAANTSLGGTGSGFVLQITSLAGWDAGMFSPADGSTTFRLPNYRGLFLRGWSNGSSIDSGRAIGTAQADAIGSHDIACTVTDPGHVHQTDRFGAGGNVYNGGSGGVNGPTGSALTGITVSASYTGASETRPRNVAGMYCIKT